MEARQVPDNKALKVLPPELPKEYRDFVACTRDTLEVPPGPLTWAKIPGVPDSLKPTATFSRGEGGAVKISISAAGLGLDVDISVTKHGNLKADTSKWPTDAPFVGDQLKDLAKGVDTWVNDLNAEFRKNNRKLGSISVKDGKLTGTKVTLDARTAMADTSAGDQQGAPPLEPWQQTVRAPIGTESEIGEGRTWYAGDGSIVPDVPARRTPLASGTFRAPALVGMGAGLVITLASAGFLAFGGSPPGGGPFVLPPVGDPVTFTGTLATTDLDIEVLRDVSSRLTMTFPDSGGLVEGSAQVVYEAQSSSGATFTNTSDLDEWYGYYDPKSLRFAGAVRHRATGVAAGQTQARELSPLFLDLTYDPATGRLSGGFQGVGFSYPASGGTTDQVTSTDPGGAARDGTFDASVLDRTDATESILENTWRLVVREPAGLSGIGVLRVEQAFDSDAFGAGCTFEAIRVATMTGTFDAATGAVTGTAKVLAWGHKSESCTFDTGVAAEEATVTGNLATSSGELDLALSASETVAGPFNVSASFDPALFVGPGQAGERDTTLPIAGIAIGIGLTLASLGLGVLRRRRVKGSKIAA